LGREVTDEPKADRTGAATATISTWTSCSSKGPPCCRAILCWESRPPSKYANRGRTYLIPDCSGDLAVNLCRREEL